MHTQTMGSRAQVLFNMLYLSEHGSHTYFNTVWKLDIAIVTVTVALHQITWLPGQSSRYTMKFISSKCNEGCEWRIYLTEVTCADTMTYRHILRIQQVLLSEFFFTLVTFATDIFVRI